MTDPAIFHAREYSHRFDKDPNYVRILRGVYQRRDDANPDPRTAHITKILAARHKIPDGAMFSHTSAARLYGFHLPAQFQDVHIYQQYPGGTKNSGEINRHTTRTPIEPLTRHGVKVVEPLRTLIDCVRTLPIGVAFMLADSAATDLSKANRFEQPETHQRWHKIRAQLQEQLNQLGPMRGIRQARAVIQYASPLADSPPESWLRLLCLQADLPEPQVQPLLFLEGQRIFPDLYWNQQGRPVVAEYDGAGKYATGEYSGADNPLHQEKIREDRIRRAGIEVVRFVHHDLHFDSAPMHQLRQLVAPEVRPHPLRRFLRSREQAPS